MQTFDSEVNFNDEINVSLRCRRIEGSMNNSKRCKGILVPNDDFSALICDKCGKVHTFHEAYREFILDELKNKKGKSKFIEGIDEDKLYQIEQDQKQYQNNLTAKYAVDIMKGVYSKMTNKNKKLLDPNAEIIEGYVIPPSEVQFAKVKYASLKLGRIKPQDYLTFIGENPDEWKLEAFSADLADDENSKLPDSIYNACDEDPVHNTGRHECVPLPSRTDDDNQHEKPHNNHNSRRPISEAEVKEFFESDNINDGIKDFITSDEINKTTFPEPRPEPITDSLDRARSLDDSRIFELVERVGKVLEPININLLHLINRDISYDAEALKTEYSIEPTTCVKLYRVLLDVLSRTTHNIQINDLNIINILSPIAKKLQNDTWSSIYKAYKMSRLSRRQVNITFNKSWKEAVSIIYSHIQHGDFNVNEFISCIRTKNLVFTDHDINQLFSCTPNEDFTYDKTVEQSRTSENGILNESTYEPTEMPIISEEKSNKLTFEIEGNQTDNVSDTLQEIINEFGMENVIYSLQKNETFKPIVKALQLSHTSISLSDLADEHGTIPTTLSALKDKAIVVAWKEDHCETNTNVSIDLYQHIIKNGPFINGGDLNAMVASYITPWDGEPIDYSKYYDK